MGIDNIINNTSGYTPIMNLFIVMTLTMFLVPMICMMTSFIRVVVTFSFMKSALGVQQNIPNQLLIGLSIFLTLFIMAPVITEINDNAIKPYMEKTISVEQAFEKAQVPIRKFLLNQTRDADLELFAKNANVSEDLLTKEKMPLHVLIPAFAISELKTGFSIGFLVQIPFVVIDLVVASALMSMGMFMLPPAMVSLPIKLLLFIMVDGWNLLVQSLILSFK